VRLSNRARVELKRMRIKTFGELREFNLAYNDILRLRELDSRVINEITLQVERLKETAVD
jgi:hypothetical protein